MSSPPPPLLLSLLLLLLLLSTTTTSTTTTTPSTNTTTTQPPTQPPTSPTKQKAPPKTTTPTPQQHTQLDPKQLTALQSLNIPTAKDPCSQNTTATCDNSTPFRHVTSLHLTNCSTDLSLSYTALKSLSTLQTLSFTNCPVSPVHFPSDLAFSLRSFSCIRSLKRLTGVWLSHFVNLTDLTVTDVPVNASGIFVILGNMKKLRSVVISNANVTGYVPKHLNFNLTHVDFSGNRLKGRIPSSISMLDSLESLDLSSNGLTGEVPTSFGDLISLKNMSLASNSLSGSIPDSMSAIPGLVHVDLGSNQFNGTIPNFFAEMKHLKYLNLEKNSFHGVLPFNLTFMERLEVFKVGGNGDLCYNKTTLSSKLKLGIAPCDKHGLPMSPPPAKDTSSEDGSESDSSDYSDGGDDSSRSKRESHHGPNKVVLGVAIALSSIVFLILFLVFLSKRCG